MPQDIFIGIFLLLVLATLIWGTIGPHHRHVHNSLIVVAMLTPVISFDLTKRADFPLELWLFCGAYLLGHTANSAYHYLWPEALHANSSEAMVQSVAAVWATSLRFSLDPELWYRGELGTVLFCIATIWSVLVVLMTIYQSELTSHARDDFDFLRNPFHNKSNAAILTCFPPALFLALFVALQQLWMVGAAIGSWILLRAVLRPTPGTT